MKHRIKVNQICKVTRTTVIEVEAESLQEARELVMNGEIDLPNADDAVWEAHWDLVSEEVDPA